MNIREYLRKSGYPIKELAKDMSVNYCHLTRVLNGTHPLTPHMQNNILACVEAHMKKRLIDQVNDFEALKKKYCEKEGICIDDLRS